MPQVIKVDEVKTRPGFMGIEAWDEARRFIVALVEDPKRREKEAVAFTAEDGFTTEKVGKNGAPKWASGAQALRNAAKARGHSITCVWDADKQWLGVKWSGPYSEMSAEAKQARKDAREANKARTNGTTPAPAAKAAK